MTNPICFHSLQDASLSPYPAIYVFKWKNETGKVMVGKKNWIALPNSSSPILKASKYCTYVKSIKKKGRIWVEAEKWKRGEGWEEAERTKKKVYH